VPWTSHSTWPSVFFDAVRFVVEDFDEFVADDFAFFLGIGDAREFFHEAVGGVDGD
jgi:hypothetical protein